MKILGLDLGTTSIGWALIEAEDNYNYLCSNFPNWKKSTCLKKNTPINIYLRVVNKFFYELIRKIFVIKYKIEKRG